jgi:hypothetical protein
MAAMADITEQNNAAGATPADGSSSLQLANKLSQVNYKNLKFIIMDRPTPYNLPSYLRELKKAVRFCIINPFLCALFLLRYVVV